MPAEIGVGRMDLMELPNGLEFYHYTSTLKQPLEITSTNPPGSGWCGLNVNLADSELVRTVGSNEVTIQRCLQSGMLVHTPGSTIEGVNEAGVVSESVFIRFHDEFLGAYFDTGFDSLRPRHGVVLFEHLDYRAEMLLREVIGSKSDKLGAHARLLEFMQGFLAKIESRETGESSERLHADDMRGLFRAQAALRNPLASDVPSISELADLAQMGMTRFKASFRAVFGVAPLRYHHKLKMDHARNELLARRKTPSELSYELGYSHPSKFTAAFKRHFEQLPSQVHRDQFRP